jgi:hypothetical protein
MRASPAPLGQVGVEPIGRIVLFGLAAARLALNHLQVGVADVPHEP